MELPIILGTILLIGVSYAWLTLPLNGTKTKVLKAGTLSLTLTDEATEGINLENTVPMLDEVAVTKIEASSADESEGFYPFSFRVTGLGVTSVVFPAGLTEIGNYTFSNNQLTSVIIQGKSNSADFTSYGFNIWSWASDYSDSNITWNG